MSKRSEAVRKWRKNTKKRLVEAMGGKCVCCDYNKCDNALEFHHLNEDDKDFSIGDVRGSIVSWARIVVEVRKCVMVCSNCHKEIHEGMTSVPDKCTKFNESFAEYKELSKMEPCPICGKDKKMRLITCSRACAAKKSGKVDWDNIDLKSMMSEMSFVKIGDTLGVSDMAVRKRARKLGLKYKDH